VDALRARGELRAAAVQVDVLQGQVVQSDRVAVAATAASLQRAAAASRAGTHGPAWSAVRALPWLGANVGAVQTVSEVIDSLATGPLPALMNVRSLVDPATLAPVNGRVNLAPLVKAALQVVAANAAVQIATGKLAAIDPHGLLAAIGAPLVDLCTQVGKVALTTATAARAVRLLPPMLGAHGPRTYLLLVQNNAEQRATGGVPTLILLRAVNGAGTPVFMCVVGALTIPAAPARWRATRTSCRAARHRCRRPARAIPASTSPRSPGDQRPARRPGSARARRLDAYPGCHPAVGHGPHREGGADACAPCRRDRWLPTGHDGGGEPQSGAGESDGRGRCVDGLARPPVQPA
jgi:hypothetical protein